jgi:hypothetical protein
MKSIVTRSLLAAALGFVVITLVLAQEPAAKPPARRVALLVGINEYQRRGFDPLRWAENDVTDVRQELAGLGFDKIVLMTGSSLGDLRPTKDNILTQLRALLADVGSKDVVLMMLCGHGQQLAVTKPDGSTQEDGFYCPVDAVVNEPGSMISLSHLTDEVLRNWGGRNLLLVDACRDGVVDRDRGIRSRGIQGRVVALPEDTAILFSCRAGQKSDERDALRHGVFSFGVLEALRGIEGVVTWGALVDRVQNRVAELNPDQDPIAAGAIGRLVLGRRAVSLGSFSKMPRYEVKESMKRASNPGSYTKGQGDEPKPKDDRSYTKGQEDEPKPKDDRSYTKGQEDEPKPKDENTDSTKRDVSRSVAAGRAFFDTARAAFKAGEYNRALELTDQAAQHMTGSSELPEFRALVFFALKRYDQAATSLRVVLSRKPNDAGGDWATLIAFYPNVSVYTEQLRALEIHCRQNLTSTPPRFVLAYLYMRQGHLKQAIVQFEKAAALKPGDTLSRLLVLRLEALLPPEKAQ